MSQTKEQHRVYVADRRAHRRAAGVCPQCGRPPEPGNVTCAECLEKQRKAQAQYYQQFRKEKP